MQVRTPEPSPGRYAGPKIAGFSPDYPEETFPVRQSNPAPRMAGYSPDYTKGDQI